MESLNNELHLSTSECGGVNCWKWLIPRTPGPSSCNDCLTFNAITDLTNLVLA